jgi:hypothetical protein
MKKSIIVGLIAAGLVTEKAFAGFFLSSLNLPAAHADLSLGNLITRSTLSPVAVPTTSAADTNGITLTDGDVSIEYSYHQDNIGSIRSSSDSVTPELYLEFSRHFSLTANFSYTHTSFDSFRGLSIDSYGPAIAADVELLHWFGQTDTDRTALYFEGEANYTRSEYSFGKGTMKLDYHGFAPAFIFLHSLCDWQDGRPGRLNLTVSPGYSYNNVASDLLRNGVVSVLGRLDYGLTPALSVNASATWLHLANTSWNYGMTDDWAVFGCGMIFNFSHNQSHAWLARIGYDYEAFISQFQSQQVTARLEFHF